MAQPTLDINKTTLKTKTTYKLIVDGKSSGFVCKEKYKNGELVNSLQKNIINSGKKLGFNSSKAGAAEVAKAFAETLKAKNLTQVVYDRNGYLYHGVIAAFADSLRENGIVL